MLLLSTPDIVHCCLKIPNASPLPLHEPSAPYRPTPLAKAKLLVPKYDDMDLPLGHTQHMYI